MRRVKMVGLLLVAVLALAGCERSDLGQNVGPVLENWRYDEKKAEENAPTPVEIETFENGNFGPSLGFDVVDMPNSAQYTPHKFFVINGEFGQIEFATDDGRNLVVRVARASTWSLASTYKASFNATNETRTIDDIEVRVRTSDSGATIATWTRGDFQYLIHFGITQHPPSDTDIETMVKTLRSKDV